MRMLLLSVSGEFRQNEMTEVFPKYNRKRAKYDAGIL